MDPKETSLYHLYLITLTVIIGLAVYYIFSALRFRGRYRKAFDQRMEAEILQLESEKERISQDLHDDIAPVLSAISMRLDSLSPTSVKQEESIQICALQLQNLTSKLRSISVALMPSVLKDKGLAIAIQQFIHTIHPTGSLYINYEYDLLPLLPHDKALHLFRIIQEIIHNTIRHSAADRLEISLFAEADKIFIATADNGMGFNYDPSFSACKGYGLANIHNRIQAIHGNLHIDTSPSKGCRFYIELPVH